MKLHLQLLHKFIELPSSNVKDIRNLLDEVGLEVKSVNTENNDKVFTIETLANRADHLSVLGIAREISAKLLTQIKLPMISSELVEKKVSLPVRLNTELCSKYSLLEMVVDQNMSLRNEILNVLSESALLRHPMVNLCNFIQLEIGQPVHSFDRDKIEGEVIIQTLEKETEIEALDNKKYLVPKDAIVICDRNKIIAVAGIIGCLNSMTTKDTKKVLIESANFDPVSIRRTKKLMYIATDAAQIFEKGADPEMVEYALKRIVYLSQGSMGTTRDNVGSHLIGYTNINNSKNPKVKITVKYSQIKNQINSPRLPEIEITTRLKYLGFGIEESLDKKELTVTVPSWRLYDIVNSEDIVEEFIRSYGLNRIKIEIPKIDVSVPDIDFEETFKEKISPILNSNGFDEVITKPYYSEEKVQILDKVYTKSSAHHIRLKNSLEKHNSALKITNLLSLLEIIENNKKYGITNIKAFEISRLFSLPDSDYFLNKKSSYEFEWDCLSLVFAGSWNKEEWGKVETTGEKIQLF